jgi:hypothetical protein
MVGLAFNPCELVGTDILLHRANSEGSMIDHFRDALDRSVRVARQTPRFASRSVAGQAELQ